MKKVKGFIQRKSMLYMTGVEYGDYTMNHVLGCAHGCKYPCYAFMLKKRFGQVKSYEEWLEPYLVSNTIEILEQEIPRLKKSIKSVHLCFTTDPFMFEYNEIASMSLSSIQLLNDNNIKCTILTKGALPIELAYFSKKNEYGITLVSLDENYRKEMEPWTATYKERITALKKLHEKGCKTWVSIEPYPTPNIINQNIYDILSSISFVDKIIFGRTNYSKVITSFKKNKEFYNIEARNVIDFCKSRKIEFYIKEKTLT